MYLNCGGGRGRPSGLRGAPRRTLRSPCTQEQLVSKAARVGLARNAASWGTRAAPPPGARDRGRSCPQLPLDTWSSCPRRGELAGRAQREAPRGCGLPAGSCLAQLCGPGREGTHPRSPSRRVPGLSQIPATRSHRVTGDSGTQTQLLLTHRQAGVLPHTTVPAFPSHPSTPWTSGWHPPPIP